jgi:hypothetical protein
MTKTNPKIPRIAVVKSSVYQDLWVCPPSKNATEIFQTTLMRTPPIALAEDYGAEFIIVRDTNEPPCHFNKGTVRSDFANNMKYSKDNKYPELAFLDNTFHKHTSIDEVAVNADDVAWDKRYDIVITINHCIPARITKQYPHILWCYYVGENDLKYTQHILDGYDIIFDQDYIKHTQPFKISFPYTFLNTHTLENLYSRMVAPISASRHGIYMEINNTGERPVVQIPAEFQYIAEQTNQPIVVHHQNIIENLERLCTSKYFVKLLGRQIRGNSVMEAISAGLIVIAPPKQVVYNELIADECYAKTADDVCRIIQTIETTPHLYEFILFKQRAALKNYIQPSIDKLFDAYKILRGTTDDTP